MSTSVGNTVCIVQEQGNSTTVGTKVYSPPHRRTHFEGQGFLGINFWVRRSGGENTVKSDFFFETARFRAKFGYCARAKSQNFFL